MLFYYILYQLYCNKSTIFGKYGTIFAIFPLKSLFKRINNWVSSTVHIHFWHIPIQEFCFFLSLNWHLVPKELHHY